MPAQVLLIYLNVVMNSHLCYHYVLSHRYSFILWREGGRISPTWEDPSQPLSVSRLSSPLLIPLRCWYLHYPPLGFLPEWSLKCYPVVSHSSRFCVQFRVLVCLGLWWLLGRSATLLWLIYLYKIRLPCVCQFPVTDTKAHIAVDVCWQIKTLVLWHTQRIPWFHALSSSSLPVP